MRFVHCHGGSLRSSFHPVLRAVFKGQSARLAQNATFSLVSRSFTENLILLSKQFLKIWYFCIILYFVLWICQIKRIVNRPWFKFVVNKERARWKIDLSSKFQISVLLSWRKRGWDMGGNIQYSVPYLNLQEVINVIM